MKMWYLFFLAAFLPIVPTVAEVVESVSDCDQFLLEAKPPHVPRILESGNILNQNRYKFICQTLEDEKMFLTLYDTKNRIPVYSALKYRGSKDTGRQKTPWKIEPQLENKNDKNKNMLDVDRDRTYNNQAGYKDYKDRSFTRGHLIANSYGFSKSVKMSTFTLTNIVPQEETFNGGSWNRMEQCIKCVMDKYCTNKEGVTEAYVVTGAQPSTTNILNNRVNIPSKLWSAFCCFSKKKKWIAGAYWGDNVPDEPKHKYLHTITLEKLQEELKIVAFPETQCPLQTTISKFYKNQAKDCQCQRTTTSSPPT
ncbi:endonuclease domain-containing 1 protein-like [Micropterus salmoides]|uniref:endonuclease domain-containing 1 protein-like n=1 Tax=Micropterus salmoides TaxID=27706 RepID=UPI0018EA4D8B|nr:endonuclease domain-containing 1 protein-like [Micropterus salmoides]